MPGAPFHFTDERWMGVRVEKIEEEIKLPKEALIQLLTPVPVSAIAGNPKDGFALWRFDGFCLSLQQNVDEVDSTRRFVTYSSDDVTISAPPRRWPKAVTNITERHFL